MVHWIRDTRRAWGPPAWALLGLLVAASLCEVGPARAQTASTTERALAETLFREARDLMQAERYSEACAKFAESQRLDPGGGTLLNLAVCHEAEGKTASAWAEFQEALAMARSDGRRDRVDLALEHIAALEPRLSKVTVEVADPPEGLTVNIDAVDVGAAAWGSEVPFDPGKVELRAEAPGHEPYVKTFEIGEGEKLTVEVPALTPLPAGTKSSESDPSSDAGAPTGSKTSAYVVGAVGVAAIGVGSYFGVRAIQEKRRADRHNCDDTECHTTQGKEADKRAVFNGWLSTAGFGAGLVAFSVATYLYFDADASDEQAPGDARTQREPVDYVVLPAVSDSGASLWLSGSF